MDLKIPKKAVFSVFILFGLLFLMGCQKKIPQATTEDLKLELEKEGYSCQIIKNAEGSAKELCESLQKTDLCLLARFSTKTRFERTTCSGPVVWEDNGFGLLSCANTLQNDYTFCQSPMVRYTDYEQNPKTGAVAEGSIYDTVNDEVLCCTAPDALPKDCAVYGGAKTNEQISAKDNCLDLGYDDTCLVRRLHGTINRGAGFIATGAELLSCDVFPESGGNGSTFYDHFLCCRSANE